MAKNKTNSNSNNTEKEDTRIGEDTPIWGGKQGREKARDQGCQRNKQLQQGGESKSRVELSDLTRKKVKEKISGMPFI